MKTKVPVCRECGVELTGENCSPSYISSGKYICKSCNAKLARAWRNNNQEKARAIMIRHHRKVGCQAMCKNRECTSFLGVHVAERVLNNVFKNAKRMPYGNRGYDFVCGRGYKIDVKSGCMLHSKGEADKWMFRIERNKIADCFLLIAFDDRESLNPLHLWLFPGEDINNNATVSIRTHLTNKWSDYSLNINDVISCCDIMKS